MKGFQPLLVILPAKLLAIYQQAGIVTTPEQHPRGYRLLKTINKLRSSFRKFCSVTVTLQISLQHLCIDAMWQDCVTYVDLSRFAITLDQLIQQRYSWQEQ
jgi:hypothetical protein